MKRRHLSPSARMNLFLKRGGKCHICDTKIIVGQRWDIDHRIPLALGGDDEESNWYPAHAKCHGDKTARDMGDIAKAKRRERNNLGIRKRSTFACSRDSQWKKKMDGSVVRR